VSKPAPQMKAAIRAKDYSFEQATTTKLRRPIALLPRSPFGNQTISASVEFDPWEDSRLCVPTSQQVCLYRVQSYPLKRTSLVEARGAGGMIKHRWYAFVNDYFAEISAVFNTFIIFRENIRPLKRRENSNEESLPIRTIFRKCGRASHC